MRTADFTPRALALRAGGRRRWRQCRGTRRRAGCGRASRRSISLPARPAPSSRPTLR